MSSKERVGLGQLEGEQFITIPRAMSPGLYDVIFQTCYKAGLSPKVAQEATQFQTAIGLVCVGMGVALVPESLVALKRNGVRYIPTDDETPVVETLMVRLQDEAYPAMARLMALARLNARSSTSTT